METVTDQFFSKHEFRINRVISRIYLALCFIPVTVCILSYAGIYNFPHEQSVIGVFISFLVFAILFLLRDYREYQGPYKYIALLGMQFIVFLYSMDVNLQMTILYMVVPIVSVLYYLPKLTLYSCILALVSMLAGTCISAKQAVEVLWHDVTPVYYVFTTGSARFMEFIAGTILLCSIASLARKMMISLKHRTEKISEMQNNLVYSFADMIESRDGTTGEHVKRTSAVVRLLVDYIISHPKEFQYSITEEKLELVALAAPLHDIGKMKVPDSILSKPGKLTNEEFEIIKTHPVEGAKIIDRTMTQLEAPLYVETAREMALYHHEKWNGRGYPEGLVGEQIPVSARIMAVADVFDALCSKRSYKLAFTVDQAFDILEEEKGQQFEPQMVEVMKAIRSDLEKIYRTEDN